MTLNQETVCPQIVLQFSFKESEKKTRQDIKPCLLLATKVESWKQMTRRQAGQPNWPTTQWCPLLLLRNKLLKTSCSKRQQAKQQQQQLQFQQQQQLLVPTIASKQTTTQVQSSSIRHSAFQDCRSGRTSRHRSWSSGSLQWLSCFCKGIQLALSTYSSNGWCADIPIGLHSPSQADHFAIFQSRNASTNPFLFPFSFNTAFLIKMLSNSNIFWAKNKVHTKYRHPRFFLYCFCVFSKVRWPPLTKI